MGWHHSAKSSPLKGCCIKGEQIKKKSLQSGISPFRGDMELICLIKCLTELAFGVQRDFKREGLDEIC